MVVTAVNYVVGEIHGPSGTGNSIDFDFTYYKGIRIPIPAEMRSADAMSDHLL